MSCCLKIVTVILQTRRALGRDTSCVDVGIVQDKVFKPTAVMNFQNK